MQELKIIGSGLWAMTKWFPYPVGLVTIAYLIKTHVPASVMGATFVGSSLCLIGYFVGMFLFLDGMKYAPGVEPAPKGDSDPELLAALAKGGKVRRKPKRKTKVKARSRKRK